MILADFSDNMLRAAQQHDRNKSDTVWFCKTTCNQSRCEHSTEKPEAWTLFWSIRFFWWLYFTSESNSILSDMQDRRRQRFQNQFSMSAFPRFSQIFPSFPRVHSSMLVGSRPAIRLYSCNQGCRVKPLVLIIVLVLVLVLVLLLIIVLVLVLISSSSSSSSSWALAPGSSTSCKSCALPVVLQPSTLRENVPGGSTMQLQIY